MTGPVGTRKDRGGGQGVAEFDGERLMEGIWEVADVDADEEEDADKGADEDEDMSSSCQSNNPIVTGM